MTSTWSGSYGDDGAGSWRYEAREPGARRRKLAGYLRAANELRQTYQQSYMPSSSREYSSDDPESIPGSFPSTRSGASVQSGETEMILFPSYAKKHTKEKPTAVPGTIQQAPGSGRDARDTTGAGDAEYWQTQWEKYEDDNAIVDVDVRGWIFTPQKGALNRKNRLFVSLARQMVGIPAPASSPAASNPSSRSSSPHPMRERVEAHNDKYEQKLVAKEAELLTKKGEAEADAARKGAYSEGPDRDFDAPRAEQAGDLGNDLVEAPLTPIEKRGSWTAPADMSAAELTEANTRLMSRLKPFLANPLGYTPISAFFYNDSVSRQKTIETDAYGHFNIRAGLDFVPTHVRILASEALSATEEVQLTKSTGVSVISDIDDTVKHSAIMSGAREIFRNVFIRDLPDLTIQGVKEWYSRLSEMDASFHYVSNSPWQLYPLLSTYRSLAGLPKGSFHLKQYSGMLQGIFEPVAERKKSSVERIMRDFPDRRFLLIGDSGEADLELYTDIVQEHPGRVLGVYIRDVTTPQVRRFFDSSMGSTRSEPSSRSRLPTRRLGANGEATRKSAATAHDDVDDDAALKAGIAASLEDFKLSQSMRPDEEEKRPALPPRRQTEPTAVEEDLIDLNSDDDNVVFDKNGSFGKERAVASRVPPARPAKPRGFSSASTAVSQENIPRKPVPAPPRRPSTSVHSGISSKPKTYADDTISESKVKPSRPPPPPQSLSSRAAVSQSSASGYSSPLKNLQSNDQSANDTNRHSSWLDGTPAPQPSKADSQRGGVNDIKPPPLPARKPMSSLPAAAAQYASSLYNAATTPSRSGTTTPSDSSSLKPSIPGHSSSKGGLAALAQRSSAGASSGNVEGSSTRSGHSLVHPNSFPLDYDSSSGQNQNIAGPQTQANKKEEIWKRRWARAESILGQKGVVLRSWRVGEDVADDCLALVRQALKEAEASTFRPDESNVDDLI